MNIKTISSILIFGALLFASCNNSSGNQKTKQQTETVQVKIYQPGSFEDIVCAKDANESYTAYFPNSYNSKEKMPAIIVFDAHARGKMAARKFQKAADNFGYLIFASNNAKNGLKTINHTVNTLFFDVFSRFNIDAKRVYTAGFSGGANAKIASSIAIQQGGIAGVISIAAGLPQANQQLEKIFDFAGIVGIDDFNYLEMVELDKQLALIGFSHKLFVTDNAHEWPSDSVINSSVEWMQIKAMKKGILPADDHIIRNYIDRTSQHINSLILSDEVLRAKYEYEVFITSLKDLIDVNEYEKSYQVLLKNPNIKKQENQFKKIAEQEGSKQQLYINYFKNLQCNNLLNEINLQNKTVKSENKAKKHSAQRLLNYIGMLSYIFTDSYLKNNNLKTVENCLKVYKTADKNNPDAYFFEASFYEKKGMYKKAISALQKAAGLGFSDAERLYNPAYFQNINTLPEFDLIVKSVKENFVKENK